MMDSSTNRFPSPIAEPRLSIAIRPLLLLLYPREINRRFEEKSFHPRIQRINNPQIREEIYFLTLPNQCCVLGFRDILVRIRIRTSDKEIRIWLKILLFSPVTFKMAIKNSFILF
jgi:hypothetical protein